MTVAEQKNEVKTDIKLIIEDEPYIEMMKYAHLFSPNECSGTGLVERIDYTDGSVEFTVKKVYLPNQENTGATTDIEEDEMNKVNTQIVEDGDDPSLHKFHWHSHVDMGVFHSTTDDENYNEMQTGDYAVSLVVNKKYDMLGSVHLYNPLRINVLNLEIEPPDINMEDYEVPTALAKKLVENIKRVHAYQEEQSKQLTFHNNNLGSYQGNYGKNWWRDERQYHTNDFGIGLDNDPDFVALLEAGEKEKIIRLIRDSAGTIVGYVNQRTTECFELASYVDYTLY